MQSEADLPLTEEWLSAAGFKWDNVERSPYRHWILWTGHCLPRERTLWGHDDFGIELTKRDEAGSAFLCWFRADYCGRYCRFLFVRELATVGQLKWLIEAITDIPFDPANCLYGSLHRPEEAKRLREEADRLDRRIGMWAPQGEASDREQRVRAAPKD